MPVLESQIRRGLLRLATLVSGMVATLAILFPLDAQALPLFARQTGQNCVACHAGGQFPELTPYGRIFKMTGYTIGSRIAAPISVMGVLTDVKVSDTSKSDDPSSDFQKHAKPIFAQESVFLGGKITDNLGAFVQVTHDNYPDGTNVKSLNGGWSADNIDFRFADHLVDAQRDLIWGISFNNKPTVSDPWSTPNAWMQYVPGSTPSSYQFSDPNTPFPGYGPANVAGLSAYFFWNKAIYGELGFYHSADKAFSPFKSGAPFSGGTTRLQGLNNPYWRLAYSHEWGPHNLMVGTSGLITHEYDDPTDTSNPNSISRKKTLVLDTQYQYLLDPHTITAQMAYSRQKTDYSANTVNGLAPPAFVDASGNPLPTGNASDSLNVFRAKLSYIYQAKYGGSLAYFNQTGSTNTASMTAGYDPCSGTINTSADPTLGCAPSTRVTGNLSGNPATRGFTYEAFWMPIQYVRVGAQYTTYSKYNGASTNYDGFGRNAKDNNTLFFYVWGAY